VRVTNILIRDIPDEVVAAIDANAQRLGLSRAEYLRRTLLRERSVTGRRVTRRDLTRFARTFRDLADPELMRRAWE
jgi:hypothetical protein